MIEIRMDGRLVVHYDVDYHCVYEKQGHVHRCDDDDYRRDGCRYDANMNPNVSVFVHRGQNYANCGDHRQLDARRVNVDANE